MSRHDVANAIQSDVMCVDSNSSSPTVTHVIPGGHGYSISGFASAVPRFYNVSEREPRGKSVSGVTSLGDDVFVVRCKGQEKIEVYDAKTFRLQRHITVPGLGDFSYGLAACRHSNCLYASDFHDDSVHRVELSGQNAVMKWFVDHPVGLSVNNEHNLLVVSKDERKLQIFTTHGTLLQNIRLQADIDNPWHAVQLPTGQFLVSHYGLFHRVCLVRADGAVVRSYGNYGGFQLTQMRLPRGLAVDREGRVLVADQSNNRLLVIDKSLSSAHEMSVSVDGGLRGPDSLWYDQSRKRLYIGEWEGGRVIVIDNLKDFTAAQVAKIQAFVYPAGQPTVRLSGYQPWMIRPVIPCIGDARSQRLVRGPRAEPRWGYGGF